MKSNAFANFCKLKNDELDYVEQRNVSHMLIYVWRTITSLLWTDDVSDNYWAQNIPLVWSKEDLGLAQYYEI